MKFKLEKKLKIINELITLFHKLGTDDVHVDLKVVDNISEFFISGLVRKISDDELSKLNKVFSIPRQYEVEQFYWTLNGESQLECELMLVGVMVDSAEVNYDNNILSIKLLRNDDDL